MSTTPFKTTSVSARTSATAVIDLLESLDTFDEIIQATSKAGRHIVIARYKGAEFRWEVDPERVKQHMMSTISYNKRVQIRQGTDRGLQWAEELDGQSLKVGWRLTYFGVKNVTDSIKLGVTTITEAFAGNLMVPGPDGPMLLAHHLAEVIENGKLSSPASASVMFLPAPGSVT